MDERDPVQSSFQSNKIHVRISPRVSSLSEVENQLFTYFSRFGSVIDIKVLSSSGLIRKRELLRVRDVRGRGDAARAALHAALAAVAETLGRLSS